MIQVPDNCTAEKFKQERKAQIQQWLTNMRSEDRDKSEATSTKAVRATPKPGKRSEVKATAKSDNIEAAPKKRKISIITQ